LGVTSASRLDSLKDVPTIDEAGLRGFEASAWSGLFAPPQTPKAIVDYLYTEIDKLLKTPEVRAKMRQQDVVARGTSPAAFSQYFALDVDRWRQLVKEIGLRAE
jgi:tripartite-type tricarboxylate transporter receptor subunit TctC